MAADNRTELDALGEFGLIDRLTQDVKLTQPSTIKGIGDDAAVIDHGDMVTVVSTDMLLEGIHFDLTYAPLKHLGYKAVVVNLSDIYAMNAHPTQVTVSVGASNRFSVEALEELYKGINLACELYEVDLAGGDTTSSRSGLVLSVTAVGQAKKEDVVLRSGASETDLLCVTGDLGAAYIGLQLLEREKQIFRENDKVQPDFGGKDYLLERQLKPEARKEVVEELARIGVKPTSMIDISDGLASEVKHLSKESKVGMRVYANKLPIDPMTASQAEEFNMDATTAALNGGEDYELLFTIPASDFEKVAKLQWLSIIGHATDAGQGINLVVNEDTIVPLQAQGWDAFNAG